MSMSLTQRECSIGAQNGKSSNSTKSIGANGGAIGATSIATTASNGSNGGAHGANGPVAPQVLITQADPKGVNSARSTDLIFLKSVVTSNTEAQHKKVSFKRLFFI